MANKVQIDFSEPPPPAPTSLSEGGQLVYNVLRENQPFGGATAKAVRATLITRGHYREDGSEYTLMVIGEILYKELKPKHLAYKVGGIGGKWRVIAPTTLE